MRGAVAVSINLNDLTVTQGEEVLTLYQFNTALEQYRVNVVCIEGMSPFDFSVVPVSEGRNHTKDRVDGGSGVAGWLRHARHVE